MKIKEFILTCVFIIIILIIYGLFPVKNSFQKFIIMSTFFIIIPILFNKFVLKNELKDLGIKIGDWKQGLIWSGISAAMVGVMFLLAGYFFDFFGNYTIPLFIIEGFGKFVFYEFLLVLPVVFIYDFFFRGFIGFIMEKKVAYWAIIIQALLFLILALATGGFNWAMLPYLVSAPLVGIIVYKSRSIFYSTLFQFIIIIIIDASIIRLIK